MEFKNEEDTLFFLQENIMTLVTRLSVRWFRIIESELNDEKQENIGNRSIISFSSLTRKGERGGGEREGNPAWRISLFAIKLCSIAIRRLQDYTCWNSENVVACCLLYFCSIIDHDQRCWSSPDLLCLDNFTSDWGPLSTEMCSKRDVISKGNRETQSLIMNDQF